jgi:hypothetical protein
MVWYVPPFTARNNASEDGAELRQLHGYIAIIRHKNAGRLDDSLPAIIS